jgi:dimethylargininase
VEELRHFLGPHGYQIHTVPVTGCLHLKSAVTALADDRLLINSAWVNRGAFSGFDFVDVDSREPAAANVLRIGLELICSDRFPRTRERLEELGFVVHALEVTELAKAEAAVTCCSLILPIQPKLTKR